MLSNPQISKWNIYSGSLTWLATPVLDNNGQIRGVAMSKLTNLDEDGIIRIGATVKG